MAGTMDEFEAGIEPIDTTQQVQLDQQPSWYAQKIQEFQQSVLAVDKAQYALQNLLDLNITDDQRLPILQALGELQERKSQIRTAAETINAASALSSQVGITLPRVNIQTLGALPLVPLAVAGAISAAVFAAMGLVDWIRTWINNAAVLTQIVSTSSNLPPDQQTRVLQSVAAVEQAKAESTTGLGSIANIVKYVAFAAAAYFAYEAFTKYQSK